MKINSLRNFFEYNLTPLEINNFIASGIDPADEKKLDLYSYSKTVAEELFNPGYGTILNQKKNDIQSQLIKAELKEQHKSRRLNTILIIIALIFLVFFSYKYLTQKSTLSPITELHLIAESTVNIDPIGTINRSDETENSSSLWHAYLKQDYEFIINSIPDDKNSMTLQFIKARALLNSNRKHESLKICNMLYTSKFNQKDALLWTLSEVHLSMGHKSQAKDFLNEIIKYKYSNYKTAKHLLTII